MNERFPHTPLDTKKSEIRLLRFLKDLRGSTIGRLERFSLDDPERPRFNTPSYAWAGKPFLDTIAINGYPFVMLKALARF